MILRHQQLARQLEWHSNQHLCELIIESPIFLRQLVGDLTTDNSTHQVGVSDQGTMLRFDRQIDVVLNPTKLDFNNRRALTALLKLLVKTSLSEEYYLSTTGLKAKIVKYLDSVVGAENFEFEVTTDDFMIDSLAKATNLHIVGDQDDFAELITDYVTMMAELAGIKLFIFYQLRSLMTISELEQFHHNLDNHQINALLLENTNRPALHGVPRIILDADECEI